MERRERFGDRSRCQPVPCPESQSRLDLTLPVYPWRVGGSLAREERRPWDAQRAPVAPAALAPHRRFLCTGLSGAGQGRRIVSRLCFAQSSPPAVPVCPARETVREGKGEARRAMTRGPLILGGARSPARRAVGGAWSLVKSPSIMRRPKSRFGPWGWPREELTTIGSDK